MSFKMKSLFFAAFICLVSIKYTEALHLVKRHYGGYGGNFGGYGGYGGRGWGYRGYGGFGGYGGGRWGYGGYGMGYPYGQGWGSGSSSYFYGKRDIQMPTEKAECYYMSSKQMITCNGGNIECATTERLDGLVMNFDMFGVGLNGNILQLYAKNFTESTFMSTIPMENGGNPVTLSIFQGGEGKGIMINDQVCYNKILGLFKGIQTPVIVDGIGGGKVTISGFVLDL